MSQPRSQFAGRTGRVRYGGLLTLTLTLAVVAAACSSNSSTASTTTTASSSGPANTVGVTPTTVTIGGIYSAGGFPEAPLGVKAAIYEANKAGGINGRKIVLADMLDDGLSPTTDLADVQKLVQVDHVFAITPMESYVFNAASYVEQSQTPTFTRGDGPYVCDNPYIFAYIGCSFPQATKVNDYGPALAKILGGSIKGKTVAFQTVSSDSATQGEQEFAKVLTDDGMKVVAVNSTIPLPPAVVGDYSPYISSLMTSNHGGQPDLIFGSLAPNQEASLISGLTAAGFKGAYIGFSSYYPQDVAAVKGAYMFFQLAPFEENSAAVTKMINSIKAVDTNNQPVDDQDVSYAYWTTKVFLQALKDTGRNLTKQTFMHTINTNFSYDVPGGLGIVQWPQYHTQARTCVSIVQSTGTAWRVAVPLTCSASVPNPLPQLETTTTAPAS